MSELVTIDPLLYPLVVGIGVICGVFNVIACCGSFVSLPLLIFCGLPPVAANATNRVGIVLQNVVGVRQYHKHQLLDWRAGRVLIWPMLVGSLLGARIAVSLDQRMMSLSIATAMIILFVVLLWNPARLAKSDSGSLEPSLKMHVALFAIGIYGGFIQAGGGVLMLFIFLASGYDMLRSHALKLLLILGYTPFALAVFIIDDQVVWSVGLALAAGNMLGAWLGVKLAIDKGAGFARYVLLLAMAASAGKLFWDAV